MSTIEIYSNDSIINAKYGCMNKYKDVTDTLISLLKNSTSIIISSNLFSFDPYYGKIKELKIKLKSNKEIKILDGDQINYIEIEEPVNNSIIESINIESINIESSSKLEDDIYKDRIEKILSTSVSNEYIVSTNARDEDNIIEWIISHLLIGFDKVVIIDHKSIVPIAKLIFPYHWKHRVVVIRNEMDGPVKLHFLNKIITPYMLKYCKKYFIHLDADEYIYIKNNYTIKELFLKYKYLQDSNIITLNWLMFGSNNMDSNPNKYKCIIPTYTRSCNIIHSHFKCMIKVNILNPFIFINPHHIVFKSDQSIYINIMGKKVIYTGDVNSHFENLKPIEPINTLHCYINHYFVQSREDYFKRKINRNRDDMMAARTEDNSLIENNEIENTNIINLYPTILNLITKIKFNFGFMIIRHINSIETNIAYQECYNSIRKFYENLIVIIDDNSNTDFITPFETVNCIYIQSEFPKRGELLPYYYYIKNKYFDRMVVLHDSMKINKYIDFNNIPNYINVTRLFSFPNPAYTIDIHYFRELCNYIKNGNLLYQYHITNINKLIGCFGVCYIIDHKYIMELERKYNISNLINIIDTRLKRQTLERFLSCLIEMDRSNSKNVKIMNSRQDLLGSIFTTLNNMRSNIMVSIEKKFFGR